MNQNPTVEMLRASGMEIPFVGFEEEIQAFQEIDKKSHPQQNGILFTGDSDIRFWNFENQFQNDFKSLPVLNRGFGGARTWEMLLYFNELILPSQPSIIVYCCGDNDIARMEEAGVKSAVLGFQLFVEMVKEKAPFVKKILYLEIHPSPVDEPLWGYIAQANKKLKEFCSNQSSVEFFEYKYLLLDESKKIDTKNFREDRLHFTPEFYQRFAGVLYPKLFLELTKNKISK